MYTLIVREKFDAAHFIPNHPGKCRNMHGHTYRVEAEFGGKDLDAIGMVMDFADLKKALRDLLPDHQCLNDVMEGHTTAEALAEWFYVRLQSRDLPVCAVTVWESETCGCRFEPESKSCP